MFGRKAGDRRGFPLFAGDEAQRHHLDAADRRHVHRRSAGVVPANRMPYAGMPDAGDRADLIAYLQKTFK